MPKPCKKRTEMYKTRVATLKNRYKVYQKEHKMKEKSLIEEINEMEVRKFQDECLKAINEGGCLSDLYQSLYDDAEMLIEKPEVEPQIPAVIEIQESTETSEAEIYNKDYVEDLWDNFGDDPEMDDYFVDNGYRQVGEVSNGYITYKLIQITDHTVVVSRPGFQSVSFLHFDPTNDFLAPNPPVKFSYYCTKCKSEEVVEGSSLNYKRMIRPDIGKFKHFSYLYTWKYNQHNWDIIMCNRCFAYDDDVRAEDEDPSKEPEEPIVYPPVLPHIQAERDRWAEKDRIWKLTHPDPLPVKHTEEEVKAEVDRLREEFHKKEEVKKVERRKKVNLEDDCEDLF